MHVARAMTPSPICVTPWTRVSEAVRLTDTNGIRHLVVVERQDLVGVLCVCDFREAARDAPVSVFMSAPVVAVGSRTTVHEAAELMRERRIGCLPVVERGHVVGIVSRRDLRRCGLDHEDLGGRECVCCRSHHEVRPDPNRDAVLFCLDCLERAGPPCSDDELGGGD